KKVPVVRELVRINHHRNCMLCHAPAAAVPADEDKKGDELERAVTTLLTTAQVPLPNEPLPSLSDGYEGGERSPDILVRTDVTFRRQDFSLMQPVRDAEPWPQMQRFDYLVRTRVLTAQEAEEYRRQAPKRQPGTVTPYHRAALYALRELTGRDTGPTAEDWRELLGLGTKGRTP